MVGIGNTRECAQVYVHVCAGDVNVEGEGEREREGLHGWRE